MAKKTKNSNGKTNIDSETFVKAWLKGGTTADVAARLGCGVNNIYGRGRSLRAAGVKLPKLDPAVRKRIDVAGLNALIKG